MTCSGAPLLPSMAPSICMFVPRMPARPGAEPSCAHDALLATSTALAAVAGSHVALVVSETPTLFGEPMAIGPRAVGALASVGVRCGSSVWEGRLGDAGECELRAKRPEAAAVAVASLLSSPAQVRQFRAALILTRVSRPVPPAPRENRLQTWY